MLKIMILLAALAVAVYGFHVIRDLTRTNPIREMDHDELVRAVIQRKISILEVPRRQRDEVMKTLNDIQTEMERLV